MPRDAEVVVVGGGVAGAATALGLARRGHAVIVLDRSRFPREKVCGEGLMPHGVEALGRLGALDAVLATGPSPFEGIGYHVGDAHAVGRFPGGRVGYGVRRSRIDLALQDACRAAGVDVRDGVRVRGISGVGGDMTVDVDTGPLRCRAVVAADGLHSPIRRQLGLAAPPSGRQRYGVRGHFALAGREPRLVDVYAADVGEFYVTPTGPGEVNVAILLERDASRALGGDLAGGFRRMCEGFPPIAELLEGATPLTEPQLVGPLRQGAREPVADGVVLVGDAASFIDGITGEGMSLGLLSAEVAADVLSDALWSSRLTARDLRPYARRTRREARDVVLLTEIILWGIRHRRLARRVVRNLGRHPDLFGRVLAVNTGEAGLASLGVGGVLRLFGG